MRCILHLDMNSYFASVEQQANPFLRGKIVGVCAYVHDNGCILAPSIEAKQVGIRTGMRVREARNIFPGIILLENDPAKYRTVTRRIFSLLSRYTERLEPYSIDEAFMDLSDWIKDWEHARLLALEMKQRIREEVGEWLRCSRGFSTHRKLPDSLFSSRGIFSAVMALLETQPFTDTVNFLSVSVSHLHSPQTQLSLFENSRQKEKAVSTALDEINNTFGEFTIVWGLMLGTKDVAPDRIGFRKTVSV